MICPKCQNVIPVTRFSCSKCGLELPVKNQEERFRAEKLARQIYAERESADKAAKEEKRRVQQEQLVAESRSEGPVIKLSPLEEEDEPVLRGRRRLVAIAAVVATLISSSILVPPLLAGNMTLNATAAIATPAQDEEQTTDISQDDADTDSAGAKETPAPGEEALSNDVAALPGAGDTYDDGQFLFRAPWMNAYALDTEQP